MFVVAGAREVFRWGHTEVFSYVGADPISDVLLVHGVLIDFVGAGARNVLIRLFFLDFYAEGEARFLATAVGRVIGVFLEVEVAEDCVLVGAGVLANCSCVVVDALGGGEAGSFH